MPLCACRHSLDTASCSVNQHAHFHQLEQPSCDSDHRTQCHSECNEGKRLPCQSLNSASVILFWSSSVPSSNCFFVIIARAYRPFAQSDWGSCRPDFRRRIDWISRSVYAQMVLRKVLWQILSLWSPSIFRLSWLQIAVDCSGLAPPCKARIPAARPWLSLANILFRPAPPFR